MNRGYFLKRVKLFYTYHLQSTAKQKRHVATDFSVHTQEQLVAEYAKFKAESHNLQPRHELINPKGVFCNNEINLKDIQVLGFDYDYTLAYYNFSLYRLIFNLSRDLLVDNLRYPLDIKRLEYLPHFPIRGLHLDRRKGWLMKIDSYHNIQPDTVYHGMNPVDKEDVIKFYGSTRLNIDDLGYSQSSSTFHHFVDLFCLPEICLLACTFQYFLDKGIDFTPEYVFQDVREAVNSIHRSQLLHKHIVQSIDDYLLPINDQSSSTSSSIYIKEFLARLKKHDKNVFLITNSPFWFVNFGMQSLCGSDWMDLFDLVICNARKPYFFTSKTKPFRQYNLKTNSKMFEKVKSFKKGEVYYEGNLYEMLQRTGWVSNGVLYFGDHIYGDLAEPSLKFGWRTGAIITEIEQEIEIINNLEFQRNLTWLYLLEKLIEKAMFVRKEDETSMKQLRNEWLKERDLVKKVSKESFNPYFGSVFRANINPTFFTRRLSRYADIYTSNVTNLLNYPIDCHFIPKRIDLAHETAPRLELYYNETLNKNFS